MMPLAFVDTETTGLHVGKHTPDYVWNPKEDA